jgi:hypothetical protein
MACCTNTRKERGSVISVELRFRFHGKAERRALSRKTGATQGDRPAATSRAMHQNLLPAKHMAFFRKLRFRLFLFLRLVSRPAYYAYPLGDEVQLSAEIMPVKVRCEGADRGHQSRFVPRLFSPQGKVYCKHVTSLVRCGIRFVCYYSCVANPGRLVHGRGRERRCISSAPDLINAPRLKTLEQQR